LVITPWLKKTKANSDGLIKCLRQRQDKFLVHPKHLWEKNLGHLLTSLHPDSFISRDSIIGAVGRRAGALHCPDMRSIVMGFLLVTETISSWHETSQASIWTWYRLRVSPWPEAHCRLPGLPDARSTRSGQVQKTRHLDTDANSLNRRAFSWQVRSVLRTNLKPKFVLYL
jgi:hypothetical protein